KLGWMSVVVKQGLAESAAALKDPGSLPGFMFQTSDVANLAALFKHLKVVLFEVSMVVSEEGITITQPCCEETLLVHCHFPRFNFTRFRCEGKRQICVTPRLHELLDNHQQRDILIWEVKKKQPFKLTMTRLRQGDPNAREEIELNLIQREHEEFEAEDQAVMTRYCFNPGNFKVLADSLKIAELDFLCSMASMEFDQEGEVTVSAQNDASFVQRIKVRILTEMDRVVNFSDHGAAPEAEGGALQKQHHRLVYLNLIMKFCAAFPGDVHVYTEKRGELIVFEVQVGALGKLRITMLACDQGGPDPAEEGGPLAARLGVLARGRLLSDLGLGQSKVPPTGRDDDVDHGGEELEDGLLVGPEDVRPVEEVAHGRDDHAL
ncbi:unnamed protein product, partial [Durusdinium trenchii]